MGEGVGELTPEQKKKNAETLAIREMLGF